MPDNAIEFRKVSYAINGAPPILWEFNLAIRTGELFVLLGRSGSGKTTTLKLINRLVEPTQGEVLVESKSTLAWNPIQLRRRIGYAVQEVGLFPHYTVEQNVALVPRAENWDEARIAQRVNQVLALVGLPRTEFAHRYPHQLSGGQRQRVGLARALAANPPILLMDEPFGALDPLSRVQLQKEFRQLQQRLQKTVAFVTHDVGEALLLGDRIALLQEGRLLSIQTPKEFLATVDPTARSYVDAFKAGYQVFET